MDQKDKDRLSVLLNPDNMLRLYACGAFPMADEKTGEISWYMPDIRCIIPLNNFNIPRSTKKFLEKSPFEIKIDTETIKVVEKCAERESTWISNDLIMAYKRLQKRGHLHSVETWMDNELVGGLYGISFRGAFFGESMFSSISQASKASLVYLINHLISKDFVLLDVQYLTGHLKMFGAVEIEWEEYSTLLQRAYTVGCLFN